MISNLFEVDEPDEEDVVAIFAVDDVPHIGITNPISTHAMRLQQYGQLHHVEHQVIPVIPPFEDLEEWFIDDLAS